MRASILSSLLPALAGAANLQIVGMGYRGGEAVKAGEEITLEVTNSTEVGSGYPGMTATHIRISVWNSIYRWTMCSLTGMLPAEDGNITVTIPPEMGPSGMYYMISAEGYSNPTNDSWMNLISGENTPLFYLTGGKGSWTPIETIPEMKWNGLIGFEDADIPCESYPCAQECATKHSPLTNGWSDDSEWVTCLSACEGVVINGQGMGSSIVDVQTPSTMVTPLEKCNEEELETACADKCCSSSEYCYEYTDCVDLPLRLSYRPKTSSTSAGSSRETGMPSSSSASSASSSSSVSSAENTPASSPTNSSAGSPQETGAASSFSVDWKVLGAVAGTFGMIATVM